MKEDLNVAPPKWDRMAMVSKIVLGQLAIAFFLYFLCQSNVASNRTDEDIERRVNAIESYQRREDLLDKDIERRLSIVESRQQIMLAHLEELDRDIVNRQIRAESNLERLAVVEADVRTGKALGMGTLGGVIMLMIKAAMDWRISKND